MVSLLDVADDVKTVPIRGKKIEVSGLGLESIIHLFQRFPELQKLFDSIKRQELTPTIMLKMAPAAIGAIIAAGTGHDGDAKHEQAAKKLTLGEQGDLLFTILDVTFPQGVGPFAERLAALGLSAGAAFGKAQATNSHAPPRN